MVDIFFDSVVIPNTEATKKILLNYINDNAAYSRRIFNGDFSGFKNFNILNMLGFTSDWNQQEIKILKLHCLESEEDNLLDLLGELTQ